MSAAPRLRVLQVIGSMHLGGQEQVVMHLARGLDRERFDVAVCCTKETGVLADQLQKEGVEILVAAPASRSARFFTPALVQRAADRWGAHLVHTHGSVAALHVGPLALLGCMPPWIHTFHFGNYSSASGKSLFAWERLFCQKAAQLVAVSDVQGRSIAEFQSRSPHDFLTIINGVHENRFIDDAQSRQQKRAELGIGPAEFLIGTVAVLTVQKGIPYLLAAARRVVDEHSNARFVIVGGGPLEGALRQEAAALGLGERVIFTGWRSDSAQLFAAFDMMVMSSIWEAMPMVLLEAMAARLPIVVTDVGDNQMVVDGGACGVIVPAASSEPLASAISGVIRDPVGASAMALRAQQRFRERFTVAQMVRNYEQLFERIGLGERG